MWKYSVSILLVFVLFSCSDNEVKLKVYGRKIIENGDSVLAPIPAFEFINQDSNIVNNETVKGKIYITDFFFTTCPSICPRMKSQMIRLYDKYKDNDDIIFLSHSIDAKHDSVEVLREFADKLDIETSKWHLVTGDEEEIYKIAEDFYMVSALEDPKAPGGYVHSGAFILMDKKGRIRGYYDGTEELAVNQLMEHIGILLLEDESK